MTGLIKHTGSKKKLTRCVLSASLCAPAGQVHAGVKLEKCYEIQSHYGSVPNGDALEGER